jgi:glycosyltransferase involved in cell wall biosynthesis
MPRVLIIQAQMKHYRVPLFTRLFEILQRDGIDLRVAYSAPHGLHGTVRDAGELPSHVGHEVKGHWLAGRMIYQPLWREIARADLVITGHENKYLMNSWLFLLSALQLKTVALWGLGPCMEEDQSRISHWLREKALTASDWYFGYTTGIVPYLTRHGVSAERITAVQNAVDTGELRKSLESITEGRVQQAKSKLGISSEPVGIYCGILEPTKHVPFLVEATRLVRQRIPTFQLLVVGAGPDRAWLEDTARANPWIHYLGQRFGQEKALALRMADIFVLPGRVGLAVLDSFAAGLPLFTTDIAIHGPEASYLVDGYNGRKTAHNQQAYADAVVEALNSPSLLGRLRQFALATASDYTIEAMAENFRRGIKQCLALRGSTSQMASVLSE